MDHNRMIRQIQSHPDYHQAGMVLTHLGVVRGFSRDGRKVTGIDISVDRGRLPQIIEAQKQRPGIVDVLVEVTDQTSLSVGDPVMVVVVAGDFRENVLSTMADTIDAIKKTVTRKTEHFA